MADVTITTEYIGFFNFIQEKLDTLFKSGACGNHAGAGRKDFTLTVEDLPEIHVAKILKATNELYEATGIRCEVEILAD